MTPEETLEQWLDPQSGGTMPAEVREAGLAVLAQLAEARAEVGRLQGEVLKWTALTKTERQFRETTEARLKAVGEVVAEMLEAHGEAHKASREFLVVTVKRLRAAAKEEP